MNNVFLIRHAESKANACPYIMRDTPDNQVELSATGHQQAEEMSEATTTFLEEYDSDYRSLNIPTPVYIWCSPYKRIRQTVAPLASTLREAGRNVFVTESVLLREMEFGYINWSANETYPFALLGRHHARYAKVNSIENGARFFRRMPGGESQADVLLRSEIFLQKMEKATKLRSNAIHIIVSHGITMRTLIMVLEDHPYEWFGEVNNPPNTGVYWVNHGYIWPENTQLKKNKEDERNI